MLLNISEYIEQKEWSIEESLLCQFFEKQQVALHLSWKVYISKKGEAWNQFLL